MWKNIIFVSGNYKKGLQVCIRKWKMRYEQVAWDEANLAITKTILLFFDPMVVSDSNFFRMDLVHSTLKSKGFLLLGTYSHYPSLSFIAWMTRTLAHSLCFSPELRTLKKSPMHSLHYLS
jgi:hypothetical protein